MAIAIVGLGYVGAVCSAAFCSLGFKVYGVDLSQDKVNTIKEGKSPIVEPGLEEAITEGVQSGLLEATTDIKHAVLNSDILLLCVGTPNAPSGQLSTSALEAVCKEIGTLLRDDIGRKHIVVRSTVNSGVTRNVLLPILEKVSGKRAGDAFTLSYNPEFLREGSALVDFHTPSLTILGEREPGDADAIVEVYKKIDAPIMRNSLEVAELVKCVNNAWHATKVVFGNEVGVLSKSCGVDGREIMDLLCRDDRLNTSKAYLTPGFAFGGSCLPKDLRAINFEKRRRDLDLPLLSSVMPSNHAHIDRAVNLIADSEVKNILFMGLSFKPMTDDLRESPVVELVERLTGKGYSVNIYDPNVATTRLKGSNLAYVDTHLPHLSELMVNDIDTAISHTDLIVLGNGDQSYRDVINGASSSKRIVDLTGVFSGKDSQLTESLCW
ncbi:MAG: nucleotide sugar dehydrogenase [Granulosicoccus sp.]|nr:nucleotide sugar dehydrogenase [Granulosicoccus sp.]